MRWRQLRELFEAYVSHSAKPVENAQRQKERWQGIRLLSVSDFISREKKAFRRWRQAGGDITDASRVEDVKTRSGPKLGQHTTGMLRLRLVLGGVRRCWRRNGDSSARSWRDVARQ